MTENQGTVFDLTERLKRSSPATLDLYSSQGDEDFERAFEVILAKAISALEQDKKNLAHLSEDGLSSILVLALNMAGLSTTRETNSNGHVDLTIEIGFLIPVRRKLGEAKIYHSPSYHVQGLEQLLGRYTTGRETHGLLIEYVKKENIAGLIQNIREKMDKDLPMQQQGPTRDNAHRWSFISVHRHSSGEDLQVGHYGCNLYL